MQTLFSEAEFEGGMGKITHLGQHHAMPLLHLIKKECFP